MGLEIERKFRVKSDAYKREAIRSIHILQGYIAVTPTRTVRLRITDNEAFLTIKGPSPDGGLSRYEWEKTITIEEARALLPLCSSALIEKVRHIIPVAEHTFEVDEFMGRNRGLVIAEIELKSPDEYYPRPAWLGDEVTGQRRYHNASLLRHPYDEWCDEER